MQHNHLNRRHFLKSAGVDDRLTWPLQLLKRSSGCACPTYVPLLVALALVMPAAWAEESPATVAAALSDSPLMFCFLAKAGGAWAYQSMWITKARWIRFACWLSRSSVEAASSPHFPVDLLGCLQPMDV
jgi:hypothetical protein